MTRVLLFLRSLIWPSVLSVIAAVVAILLALTNLTDPFDSLVFAAVSISLALLARD
jgi:phosphotransferase system  glucose/maltose/N-acetylglucosamine-specific IIC component